jgi:hypothetical protein
MDRQDNEVWTLGDAEATATLRPITASDGSWQFRSSVAQMVTVEDGEGEVVVRLPYASDREIARAELIAAAPRLLAALQAIQGSSDLERIHRLARLATAGLLPPP